MARKRAIWKDLPKWWFFYPRKRGSRKHAPLPPPSPPPLPSPPPPPSPPPAIHEPYFNPVIPNQERRDKIADALLTLAIGESAGGYDTFIPVINLSAEQGSYFLVFESTQMTLRKDRPPEVSQFNDHVLSFPDDSEDIPLPTNAMETKIFWNKKGEMNLTVLSYKTDEHHCDPIKFGGMVVEGQKVYLYDLRYGGRNLDEGYVTCVGRDAFVLDASWCEGFLHGALVFDKDNKLVGVVYHHVGSPIAVNVDRLKECLLRFFPEDEAMQDFITRA